MITLPILVLIITSLYMYMKEQEMWLDNGRLLVLIIYECMAIMHFILVFGSRRKKPTASHRYIYKSTSECSFDNQTKFVFTMA